MSGQIKAIRFGVLSPDSIVAQSVAEIHTQGENHTGGLFDPRLGCTSRTENCVTCKENADFCPGHFGHVVLKEPVYHFGYIQTVKKLLQCVCHACGKLLVENDTAFYKQLARVQHKLEFAWIYLKNKTICENARCRTLQHQYRRVGPVLHYTERRDPGDRFIELVASMAHSILKKIPITTYTLLGFSIRNQPQWMIITHLPIPPPCLRPSMTSDNRDCRGEDDLTIALVYILKTNDRLRTMSPKGKDYAQARIELQHQVTGYMDNETSKLKKVTHKSGRPTKSISARLKGKEGRIRGNLMGKRTNFSARTVITGDPSISVVELGVPISIATTLTFPETVTCFNIDRLQSLVNARDRYPGAKTVKQMQTNTCYYLSRLQRPIQLVVGDIVERHMLDGDWVLFNRQPSLHKLSMLAHRVRVMPGSTFRLNVSITPGYNADFDGDEMNLYMPQTRESMAEMQLLCAVDQHYISAQSSRPVNGVVQDSLCAAALMSRSDIFMDKASAMQLIMHIQGAVLPCPCILKPIPQWSGNQLLALCLPNFSMNLKQLHTEPIPALGSRVDAVIFEGYIVYGTIAKRQIGPSAGGIIHIVTADLGNHATTQLLDACTQMTTAWMEKHGFSVGLGDTIVSKQLQSENREILEKASRAAKRLWATTKKSCTSLEYEQKVRMLLDDARDEVGRKCMNALTLRNNIVHMMAAGSKGSIVNVCQISACLGQQVIEGARVPMVFKNRTLPHFQRQEETAKSRGFVQSSFIGGLDPVETFFHAMGGREGLVDTAIKTSDVGYLARRLVKALEDLVVQYDGTVRNSRQEIVQFCYGEDGFDGTTIVAQTCDLMTCSHTSLQRYIWEAENDKEVLTEAATLLEDRAFLRDIAFSRDDRWFSPVAFSRLLCRAKSKFGICHYWKPSFRSDMIIRVRKLRANFVQSHDHNKRNVVFGILLQAALASRPFMKYYHLGQEALDWCIEKINQGYQQALVSTGEAVGLLAASSCGEPATQLTLNTFHSSGRGNATVLDGIPRLKEIVNVCQSPKTPSMVISLLQHVARSKAHAQSILDNIVHVTLASVTSRVEIIWDATFPHKISTQHPDYEMMHLHSSIPNPDRPGPEELVPWTMRIVLDKTLLCQHRLLVSHVKDALYAHLGRSVYVLATANVQEIAVIQVRLRVKEGGGQNGLSFFRELLQQGLLQSITLKGISGIREAVLVCRQMGGVDPDDSLVYTIQEWVIQTVGVNMYDVALVDGVDTDRLWCNDPREMLRLFGIDVARDCILKEVRKVVEDGGTSIGYRHLALLSEAMTANGIITSITRHGFAKTGASVLTRCTFEKSVDILLDGATFNEENKITSVPDHIILGSLVPVGTGVFSLRLNESQLQACRLQPDITDMILADVEQVHNKLVGQVIEKGV